MCFSKIGIYLTGLKHSPGLNSFFRIKNTVGSKANPVIYTTAILAFQVNAKNVQY